MKRLMLRLLPLLLGVTTLSCGAEESSSGLTLSPGEIPKGAFALVSFETLSLGLLDSIPPAQAERYAESFVHDALFAMHARSELAAFAPPAERGILSRALIEQMERQEFERRPPTEEEYAERRRRDWVIYDRPRAVRTVDLFVAVPPMADDAAAYAYAQQLQAAARGKHNLSALVQALDAIDSSLTSSRRRIPPLAANGKVVPMTPQDHALSSAPLYYAVAASKLKERGSVSEIIAAEGGYHVLYAVEIVPEQKLSAEQARTRLTKQLMTERIGSELEAVRKSRKAVHYEEADLTSRLRLVWRQK